MARFLLDTDYSSIIQSDDLAQITEGVSQNLIDAESKAISRMRSKLIQRYIVDIELGLLNAYSASRHYRTKERILSGTTIYYVKTYSRWVSTTKYATNDVVTDDNGYVYIAAQDSQNQPLTSTTYWTAMVNIVNTNTTYWVVGDNRYPMFVEIAMDLALYNIYSRINPRNIPALRVQRNKEALDQLERWGSGTDTAEVLEVNTTEQTGFSIRYGSSIDKTNNFF
jgi:hypothetical protein